MWPLIRKNVYPTLYTNVTGVKDPYVNNEDEVVIEVEDFDVESISIYYYWYIHGGRLVYCQECGKLVLSQSKTYTEKYCKKCAKEKELSSKREYWKKIKN